jgi:hypothetical protein
MEINLLEFVLDQCSINGIISHSKNIYSTQEKIPKVHFMSEEIEEMEDQEKNEKEKKKKKDTRLFYDYPLGPKLKKK